MSIVLKELFMTLPEWDKFSERPDDGYKVFETKEEAFSCLRKRIKTQKGYESLYGFELLDIPQKKLTSGISESFKENSTLYFIGKVLNDRQVSKLKQKRVEYFCGMPVVREEQHVLACLQQNGRKDWDVVVELRSPLDSDGEKYHKVYPSNFVLNENLEQIYPKPTTLTKWKMPFLGGLQNYR